MGPTTQIAKKKIELGKTQPAGASSDTALDPALEIKKDEKRKHRTRGLWLFDVLLYPVITNVVVFAISVYATYLTTNGGDRIAKDGTLLGANNKAGVQYTDKDGKLLHGKLGHFFHARGSWLTKKFEGWFGMSHGQADMAKMVFFSFADGTLVAPLVKLLEDRREKIARGLDRLMGTLPADESVYAAEPKQSWASVIMGRLAVVSIVVPTAVVLEKIGSKNGQWNGKWTYNLDKKKNPEGKNLNDKLFNDLGYAKGEQLAAKPSWAKVSRTLDIPYLFKTVYFEAFYTTVCTVGLYFSSRFLATLGGKPAPKEITTEPTTSTLPTVHSVTVTTEKEQATERKFATDNLKHQLTAEPSQQLARV